MPQGIRDKAEGFGAGRIEIRSSPKTEGIGANALGRMVQTKFISLKTAMMRVGMSGR
jgi:hypothetical protein